MRVNSEQAFVLHTRAYRETSQLVDIFSRHHGRLRLVAKGSRGGSSKKTAKALMPFTAYLTSWSGKGELKNLLSAEAISVNPLLRGERLYSGFYLNELLIRLLAEHDPHEELFDHYQQAIEQLVEGGCLETLLRQFEARLLEEIGYGLVIEADAETGEQLRADAWYWYDPEQGLAERLPPAASQHKSAWFCGRHLQAIAENDLTKKEFRRDAKRLLRLALKPHLGDKPLQSRELLRSLQGQTLQGQT